MYLYGERVLRNAQYKEPNFQREVFIMKRLLKKAKCVLLVGLAAMLLSTSAYSAETEITGESGTSLVGGTYCKNAITGEVTFIPDDDTDLCSDEFELNSPSYDPRNETLDFDNILPRFIKDNRVKIPKPQDNARYCTTVYITATTAKGNGVCRASGFMIGPNAVATAGHVLFDKEGFGGDGWITSATITPAKNTLEEPCFGSADAIAYQCGGDWARKSDYNDDWGIIILNKNIGYDAGLMGKHSQSSAYSSDTVAYFNGYPKYVGGGSKEQFDLYTSFGSISSSESKKLHSENIYMSKGDSGGPCYIISKTYGYQAIGIASYTVAAKDNPSLLYETVYRRIDKALYDKFAEFEKSTL